MPDHISDLLIRFLEQNKGVLSNRAKEKEFKKLSKEEIAELENIYQNIFDIDNSLNKLNIYTKL